jgi:S-adenosyl-L-methionine hydrolase (adenosine-forming)
LSAPRHQTISFLSDYGLVDEFVGVVKGVIRRISPHAPVIDITHDIAPYDIRGGGLALARSVQYLPAGVVLGIVDPAVGTDRRLVAVETNDDDRPLTLVGPDNGLLASAVAMSGGARRAVSLTNTEYHLPAPGSTFAGRDVLGPAAAYLTTGVDLANLGEQVDPLSLLPGVLGLCRVEDDRVEGEVLWIDRFGNAQLNVGPEEMEGLGERIVVRAGHIVRPAVRAGNYAELNTGQLGLVVDSYGLVAVVLNRRSAGEELQLAEGDRITLEPGEDT